MVELRHGAWNAVAHTLADETKSGRLCVSCVVSTAPWTQQRSRRWRMSPRDEVDALLDHLAEMGVLELGVGSAIDFYAEQAAGHLAGRPTAPVSSPDPPIVIGDDGPLAARITDLLGPNRTLKSRRS